MPEAPACLGILLTVVEAGTVGADDCCAGVVWECVSERLSAGPFALAAIAHIDLPGDQHMLHLASK